MPILLFIIRLLSLSGYYCRSGYHYRFGCHCRQPGIQVVKARKTCPYCGGKPELSVVHEKEGHRSLFCTDCGRHWRFQRTACPSCGCDKPDNLRLHFAESTPDERAVSCKNCGHYILEADIRKRDLALDGAAIVCLGMGYLDALMQEQGLLPLGESA